MKPIVLEAKECKDWDAPKDLSKLVGLKEITVRECGFFERDGKRDVSGYSTVSYRYPEYRTACFARRPGGGVLDNDVVVWFDRTYLLHIHGAYTRNCPEKIVLTFTPIARKHPEVKAQEMVPMQAKQQSFLKLFGQPVFIQTPVFPSHEGKCAFCLMTLETGWGDCGNVNVFLALDAKDKPVKAWFEASCC